MWAVYVLTPTHEKYKIDLACMHGQEAQLLLSDLTVDSYELHQEHMRSWPQRARNAGANA